MKSTTPYGKLPLLFIGDSPDEEPKTQSQAMLRYAGLLNKDAELYTTSDIDRMYDIEEAVGLAKDLNDSWTPNLYMGMRPSTYGYSSDFAKTDEGKAKLKEMREKWVEEQLPIFLKYVEDRLTKSKGKWLCAGDKPTIADCYLVPFLRGFSRGYIDHVKPTCLEGNPIIVKYIKDFCALDGVKGKYDSGIFQTNIYLS